MADLPQYTGVTYDSSYYKQPNESASDYFMRLAQQRAGGILGGGGMLNTPTVEAAEVTAQPLGQVSKNCPAGYVSRNGACVPVSQLDSMPEEEQPTMQERYEGARRLLDNPMLAAGVRAITPLGLGNVFLRDDQIEGYVRNAQNEATKSQGFLDYLMGNDGDVVLGDLGDSGSLVTGKQTEITRGMFPEIFDPTKFSATYGQAQTFPAQMPQFPTTQEQQVARTLGMMDTLAQLNSGSISGGDSGYYTDTGGNSYTGGSDYGGWTGVTADGSGNDWDSFGGDDTY
jgi:hypothetical protein